jgi:hypothetical protein
MDENRKERPVITTTNRARQGVTGHNVRYVLAISIALLAVIFGGLWLFYLA